MYGRLQKSLYGFMYGYTVVLCHSGHQTTVLFILTVLYQYMPVYSLD